MTAMTQCDAVRNAPTYADTSTLTTHCHSRFRCPSISLASVHDKVQLCNQARHRQTGVEEFFAQLQLEEFRGMDRDGNVLWLAGMMFENLPAL